MQVRLYISCASKKIYADDTLIYRIINTTEDISMLQRDLNTLTEWASKWLANEF